MNLHRIIATRWQDERNAYREKKAWITRYQTEIARVMDILEDIEASLIRVEFDSSTLDLNYSGNYQILKAIFRLFRHAGYSTDDHTGDKLKIPSHTMWFRKDGRFQVTGYDSHPVFYVQFASTSCKQIKIGTRTVEQPIYETVCE